jgi:hypothetical protein
MYWAELAYSIWLLATCWAVRGLNARGTEIIRTDPDRPWGSPSLQYSVYRVIIGGKGAGGGIKHPQPSNAEVNPLKTARNLFYTRTQCVPRCKHSPLRL